MSFKQLDEQSSFVESFQFSLSYQTTCSLIGGHKRKQIQLLSWTIS